MKGKIFNISGVIQAVGESPIKFTGEIMNQYDGSFIGYLYEYVGCCGHDRWIVGDFVEYFDAIGMIFHKYNNFDDTDPILYFMPDINTPNRGCWISENVLNRDIYWDKKMTNINITLSRSDYYISKKRIVDRFKNQYARILVRDKLRYHPGWYKERFSSAFADNIV